MGSLSCFWWIQPSALHLEGLGLSLGRFSFESFANNNLAPVFTQ